MRARTPADGWHRDLRNADGGAPTGGGTGPQRRRGNAFYAESARSALGLRAEVHTLSDVPLPLVHTALGAAVCAVVAALRPQVLGLRGTVIICGSLAIATALTLTLYDRLVYGRDLRHAMAATFLPVAAIAAFVVVLGSNGDLRLRVAAGAVAALVIGGIPHLGGLRAAGREGTVARLMRDGAGIAVLAPLLLASFGGGLATSGSLGLCGCGVLLVSADALLTEEVRGRVAVTAAAVISGLLCAALVLLPVSGRGTIRAGLLLVVWYGLRGLAAALLARGTSRALIAEYGAFVIAAASAIAAGVLRGWGA
ncbi:MAG: hypothetical protein JF887_09045 [Candidatus Dormibacteraeota bacterium]|uniref:Uncharacterized protein n=1 Tax=Candidatus Amunia macphersoniae TaxID=3127014 RepID=A0A934KIS7_9BACT|nr:hypothetical protein [Candidatus Dormibacteraeota bacterium]